MVFFFCEIASLKVLNLIFKIINNYALFQKEYNFCVLFLRHLYF